MTGCEDRDYLTGNWGVRDELSDNDITFSITYTGEVFGLVSGGIKQGATYDEQFLPQIDVDLDKLIGWQGPNGTLISFGGGTFIIAEAGYSARISRRMTPLSSWTG